MATNWALTPYKSEAVQYRVKDLGSSPTMEVVVLHGRCASLYRYNKFVAQFVVSPGQRKKIRSRKGVLNITTEMLAQGAMVCSRERKR